MTAAGVNTARVEQIMGTLTAVDLQTFFQDRPDVLSNMISTISTPSTQVEVDSDLFTTDSTQLQWNQVQQNEHLMYQRPTAVIPNTSALSLLAVPPLSIPFPAPGASVSAYSAPSFVGMPTANVVNGIVSPEDEEEEDADLVPVVDLLGDDDDADIEVADNAPACTEILNEIKKSTVCEDITYDSSYMRFFNDKNKVAYGIALKFFDEPKYAGFGVTATVRSPFLFFSHGSYNKKEFMQLSLSYVKYKSTPIEINGKLYYKIVPCKFYNKTFEYQMLALIRTSDSYGAEFENDVLSFNELKQNIKKIYPARFRNKEKTAFIQLIGNQDTSSGIKNMKVNIKKINEESKKFNVVDSDITLLVKAYLNFRHFGIEGGINNENIYDMCKATEYKKNYMQALQRVISTKNPPLKSKSLKKRAAPKRKLLPLTPSVTATTIVDINVDDSQKMVAQQPKSKKVKKQSQLNEQAQIITNEQAQILAKEGEVDVDFAKSDKAEIIQVDDDSLGEDLTEEDEV